MSGHDWGTGDDRLDDLLRSTLHEEADTIMPAGDGLSKIQQQVLRRRRRERWLRPGLAIGSAAAVAAIGVGVYAATNHTNPDRSRLVSGTTPTPHPTVSPSPSVVPVTNVAFPKHAIFPFTSSADEKSWESGFVSGGHSPWKADPVSVATTWVTAYLQQPTVDQLVSKTTTPGGTAIVTLGRTMTAEQGQTVAVTAVHLVRFGMGWVVVGATDPQNLLKLAAPKAGSLAVSPLSVTGPGFGSDEAVRVQVRDAVGTKSYGEGSTDFGGGVPQWSVSVPFTRPAGRVGVLVATESSAADGGPTRIVARQLTFNSTSGSTTPPYFYAVKSQRVAQFDSATGAFSRYLTTYQPGGGPSDPQLGSTGDIVYFLQGNGTCANTLMSVSATGGAEQLVANPVTGYVISGFAVGPAPAAGNGASAPALALVESKCAGTHGAQAKLVTTDAAGARHVIKFPSTPPVIESDPSWAVPVSQPWTTEDLIAWVRTGNQGYLAEYAVTTDTSATPARNACSSYDVNAGMPTALEVDGTGALWFATQTGTSMDVVRCDAHGSTTEFSVPGQDTPSDVDVTSDGTAVLLTDTNGKVWRWSGSGNAVRLPTTADHVTW